MLLIPAALHISLSIGHVLPHGFEDWMTVATFGPEPRVGGAAAIARNRRADLSVVPLKRLFAQDKW
jgi:hypothetical protein